MKVLDMLRKIGENGGTYTRGDFHFLQNQSVIILASQKTLTSQVN